MTVSISEDPPEKKFEQINIDREIYEFLNEIIVTYEKTKIKRKTSLVTGLCRVKTIFS